MPTRSELLRAALRLRRSSEAAFTLLEVVIAVSVFALGMVAVAGLLAPVAKSAGTSADAEAAVAVAATLRTKLAAQVAKDGSFAGLAARLKVATATGHQLADPDNNPNAPAADPRRDPQLLFASRDGLKIGAYDDPIWGNVDVDKFFEIALARNEAISPNESSRDEVAAMLAYTARIRWPAFVPDATPTNPRRALPAGFNATGAVRFDSSMKQVLFVAGAVAR